RDRRAPPGGRRPRRSGADPVGPAWSVEDPALDLTGIVLQPPAWQHRREATHHAAPAAVHELVEDAHLHATPAEGEGVVAGEQRVHAELDQTPYGAAQRLEVRVRRADPEVGLAQHGVAREDRP